MHDYVTPATLTIPFHRYLQSESQANEINDHFFVGKLDAEKSKQGKETLIVLPAATLLFTPQVDVPIQLLAVLVREGMRSRHTVNER